MGEGDPLRELPECDTDIVNYWHMCGMVTQSGMGVSSLTWQEVESFSRLSSYYLSGWEAEQVVMMSRDYLQSKHAAETDVGYPAPYAPENWREEALAARRKAVAEQFKKFRTR